MAYIGMRGTGSWENEERPKSWEEMILRLYPNGQAPLTAILSKMSSETPSDPEFSWWTKKLPQQRVEIVDVYTDAALTTGYTNRTTQGGIGAILYLKAQATPANEYLKIKEFRKDHQILLRKNDDPDVDVVAKVLDIHIAAAATSYIKIKLLEADDAASHTTRAFVKDMDAAFIIGNMNAEGAKMPIAVTYDAIKWRNYTQIFRNKHSLTRTAYQTKNRLGKGFYDIIRFENLETHSVEMEKAFWFGIATENIDETNGKKVRTTQGIIPAIKGRSILDQSKDMGGIKSDYRYDTDFTGTTWVNGGEEWLRVKFEEMFRLGDANSKLAFVGSGTLSQINSLVKKNNRNTYNLSVKERAYGIMVNEWITPFGSIDLIVHPLFAYEPTLRNSMAVIEPRHIKSKTLQPTFLKQVSKSVGAETGHTSEDAITEEFLTEKGLEFVHPETWGWLTGFGENNTLTISAATETKK